MKDVAAQKGISVRDLTVTYRNGHTALRDASFTIPTGTICGLVGVNGSGESTLFKALIFRPVARLPTPNRNCVKFIKPARVQSVSAEPTN